MQITLSKVQNNIPSQFSQNKSALKNVSSSQLLFSSDLLVYTDELLPDE